MYRGDSNFKLKNYEAAKKDYEKSVQLFKKYYLSLNNRGVTNYKQGNFKKALKDFNKSLKLSVKFSVKFQWSRKTIFTHTDAHLRKDV